MVAGGAGGEGDPDQGRHQRADGGAVSEGDEGGGEGTLDPGGRLLFMAAQVVHPRDGEPTRHYLLHCPGHGLTTELDLPRRDGEDDAEVLGAMVRTLRRHGVTQGVVCGHVPGGRS